MTTRKTKRTQLAHPAERESRSFSPRSIRTAAGYLLDRLTEAAIGAYALATGPSWLKAIEGTLVVPEAAIIALCSFFLVSFWLMIAFIKGKFDLS